jgi:hypothetical protein
VSDNLQLSAVCCPQRTVAIRMSFWHGDWLELLAACSRSYPGSEMLLSTRSRRTRPSAVGS